MVEPEVSNLMIGVRFSVPAQNRRSGRYPRESALLGIDLSNFQIQTGNEHLLTCRRQLPSCLQDHRSYALPPRTIYLVALQ